MKENNPLPHTNQTPRTPPFLLAQERMSTGGGDESVDDLALIKDRGLRILLVDDRADHREGMRFMLDQTFDAEVTGVGSGAEAVEAVRAGGVFDVIFIDVRMWPMKGIETYKALKAVDPACRAVMMSAYADSEDWDEAESLGIDLIPKPISKETMTQILRRVGSRP